MNNFGGIEHMENFKQFIRDLERKISKTLPFAGKRNSNQLPKQDESSLLYGRRAYHLGCHCYDRL